jgi:hypothetical protein
MNSATISCTTPKPDKLSMSFFHHATFDHPASTCQKFTTHLLLAAEKTTSQPTPTLLLLPNAKSSKGYKSVPRHLHFPNEKALFQTVFTVRKC